MASSGSKAKSTASKARDVGGTMLGSVSPIISDTIGSLIAHGIRDLATGGMPDSLKDWLTGKSKPTEVELQKGLESLPAAERGKLEQLIADFKENAKIIEDHPALGDDDKKKRIDALLQVYLAALPSAKKSGSKSVDPAVSVRETMESWSPELHEIQRRWFDLLPEAEKELYAKNMAHLAPVLAPQLRPFLPEKEGQKRVSRLSDLEGALKGVSLERYKLWYRHMTAVERSAFSTMANGKRLTARIVESVLELAEVPAPKISDFETFLDENKVRKSHDEFIRHLDPAKRIEFRGFRDRLHPGMLKDKLSGIRWTPDVARDVYIELENIAGGRSTVFDTKAATEVLKMIQDRLLDEPLTDPAKPELDTEAAITIFRLIRSSIPAPKLTAGQKVKEYLDIGKDLAGQVDDAIKGWLPYEKLELPDFKDQHEVPEAYVERLVVSGDLDRYRLESESLRGVTDPDMVAERNQDFIKRLLDEPKFMSKVDAKVNEFIRHRKLAKISK